MLAQKITNEIDSVSYSLGVNIGENIKSQFPDIDLKNFELAIKDVLDDKKEPKICLIFFLISPTATSSIV